MSDLPAFARDWIESWNAHDLDRVLAHYTDDFEMSSPRIAQVVGEVSGRLVGKATIGAYWRKALANNPGLRFELLTVFSGINTATLLYRNQAGMLVTENFWFNDAGKVCRACANYEIKQ